MPSQNEIRDRITSKIINSLESDLLPWRRPWRTSPNAGRPTSFATGKPYQGVNVPLLQIHADQFGFSSKWWATFRQWRDRGYSVRKRPANVKPGEWGATAILYKPIAKTRTGDDGEEVEDRFFILRTFALFNADQVDGAEEYQVGEEPGGLMPDFAPADELIAATGASIRHQGDRAYYLRPFPEEDWPNHDGGDDIVLPPKHYFNPVGSYFETAFHELAHWSEIRLGWDHQQHGYAMGELVAEMASSFLATELQVPQRESLENHASYVRSWIREMENDPSWIMRASRQASNVADFLLGFVNQEQQEAATVYEGAA